ncbi:MAG: translocation/assembly module TamB domain-containing protein [Proteobacteria bacterium]|nr:translocation/assembly module TamB domain-containing protein [Pseudomonadota bacterium]
MKNGTVQHGTLISLVDAKIIRRSKSNLVDQQSADIDKNEPSGSAEDQVNISIRSLPADSPTNQLEFFPFIAPLAAKAGVAGTVSGSTKLSGNFKKLIGVSKLKLENVTILGSKVPAVVGSLVIDGSKMEIMADQGGNALKGRLNFDFLEKGIPYSWFLATKNFDLRPFLPKVFSSDPRNFAYVTATWSLKGLFQDWWKSTGSLDIKNFESKIHTKKEYSKPPFEIKSRDLVQVKMRPDGWQTVDGKSLTLESIHGALQLGLQNSKPPEQLGISINGKLSLEILRTIIPKIEVATGQVQFNGGLFGPAQDPKINLSFSDTKISAETASTWQPVSIGTAEFRPPIKDMKIEATLTSDEIQISSLKGNKGTGKISAEGVISLNRSNGKLTDLAINLDEASFLYPFPIVKNFDSILDGNLRITGSKFPLLAGGQIIVKRARSNREIDIRNAIVESLRSSSLGSSGPESLDPSINFDINILANDSISFNSRTAQAVLSSDLKLAGTEISPEITGVVELKKGKFLYKRDFVIQRGLVNFDDPVKPDPSLDISAQSEVSGYKVNITISGKASEPIVDFSIDPPTRPDGSPITKLEIIQLLNRGSLPEQSLAVALSNVGEGDNGESTAATEALNLLAGQVEDTVQRVFDLSGQNIIRQVYIDTYVSDEKPIARFNLPLSLTDDLDLILKVDQSTVQITSELALHDSISLLGGVESNSEKKNGTANRQGGPADTGVDVKFKFAFP